MTKASSPTARIRQQDIFDPALPNNLQAVGDLVGIHHVDTEGVKFVVAIHLPTPKSRRFSETRSNVATRSANKTGVCQGRVITAVPRRNVVVFAARYVIRLSDAETSPRPVK